MSWMKSVKMARVHPAALQLLQKPAASTSGSGSDGSAAGGGVASGDTGETVPGGEFTRPLGRSEDAGGPMELWSETMDPSGC